MNIALFSDTYLPDINGVVSSIETLRQKLEEAGHNVYVVCTFPGGISNFKVQKEGNIIRLPGIELKQLYGYAMASPFHFSLINELKELKLDIIHAHTEFGVGIFARFVAKNLNIPLVSTYHTTYEDYTHYVNPIHLDVIDGAAKKAVARLSKMYIDSCVRVISPSVKTKTMLMSYGVDSSSIKIIPTGLDLKRFNPDNLNQEILEDLSKIYKQENQKLLVYLGRIAAEKSIDLVIRSFSFIKEKGLNLKLLVVGSGPELDNLNKLVEQLNLQNFIQFAGKKSPAEVPYYYGIADGFISASTTETQGMTYIEALASGLPIFARRDDVVKELIDEQMTGFYFDDETDLANCLEEFSLLTKDEWKEKSKLCQEKVIPYDADIFLEQVVELYREAIDEFSNYYEILTVKIKNDNVVLKLKNENDSNIEILLSLDDYYEYGIRKKTRMSERDYLIFKKKEEELKAYAACYKKISIRDYTVKQMYDFIINKFDLPIDRVNAIIDKLEEKRLLDDSRYASYKLESFNHLFYSKKKIIKSLQKDGVSMEIIDRVIEDYDGNNEFEFAIHNARRYYKRCSQRSIAYIKRYIYEHLKKDGFTDEAITVAMDNLDFSDNEKNRLELLRKYAYKATKRFDRKSKGSQLRNKVFRYLFAQGFDVSDIYAILDEMEWEND